MPQFDITLLATILAAGGLGVTGLTEMLKRLLKWEDFKAYLISAVVSLGVTAFVLSTGEAFTVLSWLIYSVAVFLQANGIYKFTAKT